jgi:hypothetical protein
MFLKYIYKSICLGFLVGLIVCVSIQVDRHWSELNSDRGGSGCCCGCYKSTQIVIHKIKNQLNHNEKYIF